MTVSTVASPEVLTHYLKESPDTKSRQLSKKARLFDLAAKVTLVALLVITSALMVMTVLGTSMLSPGYFALALGLAIATPVLYHFESKFRGRTLELKRDACIEQDVAANLLQIHSWNPEQLAAFYQTHNITPKPGQTMLPLIARFNYWERVHTDAMSTALLHLNAEATGNKLANQTAEVQKLTQERGWEIMEKLVLPAKLQSAVILGLLHNPNREIDLAKLGRCEVRPIEQNPSEKDNYFTFASKRPPITIYETLVSTSEELSQKLLS